PDYFLTVTLPWTFGMLLFLFVFLYAMRTDGCVYRRLTHSYTPPAVRQQLAEEERRERQEETERTATNAWESERARWRSQRSPRPDASTDAVSSSSSGPAPTVSWAERPAAKRSRGQGRGAR
ncbi:uncharacterized protein LOC117643989, partial [Thrips palmi]|uniref:Uncharacterized protein LOC117643989 n=1 Tax=Thrips palmi TaxID=161013 RepID=A0A6P8YXV4_THRPL